MIGINYILENIFYYIFGNLNKLRILLPPIFQTLKSLGFAPSPIRGVESGP